MKDDIQALPGHEILRAQRNVKHPGHDMAAQHFVTSDEDQTILEDDRHAVFATHGEVDVAVVDDLMLALQADQVVIENLSDKIEELRMSLRDLLEAHQAGNLTDRHIDQAKSLVWDTPRIVAYSLDIEDRVCGYESRCR